VHQPSRIGSKFLGEVIPLAQGARIVFNLLSSMSASVISGNDAIRKTRKRSVTKQATPRFVNMVDVSEAFSRSTQRRLWQDESSM
jgi:hypothetical protein